MRCPVCGAGFRGTRECSRCGADLSLIILFPARALRYREKARNAMYMLNFKKACDLATAAQKVHATETGRKLVLLTSWLNSEV